MSLRSFSVHARKYSVFFLLLAVVIFSSVLFSQIAEGKKATVFKPIRIGFSSATISEVDQKDAKVALKAWADLISEEDEAGFKSEVEIYRSLELMAEAIRNNNVDLVIITPLEFLQIKEQCPIIPTFVGLWDGKADDAELLLVNVDSKIISVDQLKRRSILLENYGTGQLPFIWLETVLLKNKLPEADKFFAKVKTVQQPSKAALPVFFGQADACILKEKEFKTIAELNPQIGRKLVSIASSPLIISGIGCCRKTFDENDLAVLKKSAFKLQKSARGRQILTLFKVDQIDSYKDSYLETSKEILREYESMKNKSKFSK